MKKLVLLYKSHESIVNLASLQNPLPDYLLFPIFLFCYFYSIIYVTFMLP